MVNLHPVLCMARALIIAAGGLVGQVYDGPLNVTTSLPSIREIMSDHTSNRVSLRRFHRLCFCSSRRSLSDLMAPSITLVRIPARLLQT